MRARGHVLGSENGVEEDPSAGFCDTPEIAVSPIFEADAAGTWQRREQHTARLQNTRALLDHAAHIIDDMEGLCHDQAVVGRVGNVGGITEIGDDSCP